MQTPLPYEEQKDQIGHYTRMFLSEQFGFFPPSVHVLMDDQMVVIRIAEFLSAAEAKMGTATGKTNVIGEIYSKLYHAVKQSLVDHVSAIISKKVLSSQVTISFETKILIMSFLLASNRRTKN
jgi:uncharacterized protein YbcI